MVKLQIAQILQLLQLICNYVDIPSYVTILSTCRTIRFTFPFILTPANPKEITKLPSSENFFLANMCARTVQGPCDAIDLLLQFLRQPSDLEKLPDFINNPHMRMAILQKIDQLALENTAWLDSVCRIMGKNILRHLRNVSFRWAYDNNYLERNYLAHYHIDCRETFVAYIITQQINLTPWEIRLILRRDPVMVSSLQFCAHQVWLRVRSEFDPEEWPEIFLQTCHNHEDVILFSRALRCTENPQEALRRLDMNWRIAVIRLLIGNLLLPNKKFADQALSTINKILCPIFLLTSPNKAEERIIKHLQKKHDIPLIFPT